MEKKRKETKFRARDKLSSDLFSAFLIDEALTRTLLGLLCGSLENPALQTPGMSISQSTFLRVNHPQIHSRAISFLYPYTIPLSLVFSLSDVLVSSPTLFFSYKY